VTAAVVTLPLLLLYNAGLMMPGNKTMNTADLLTTFVVDNVGLYGFLAVNGLLVLISVVAMVVLARQGRFRPGHWVALCGEGLVMGLVLGHLVIFIMGKAYLLGSFESHDYSIAQALSLSAGAGYWEELVFRLFMVGGPIAIARRLYPQSGVSDIGRIALVAVLAVVVSSFLFSITHYLGVESFDSYTFWYRSISGIVFSGIFLLRGFAVAAYSHFLYDVVVMVF